MKPPRLRAWCAACGRRVGLTVHSGCQTQQPETLMTLAVAGTTSSTIRSTFPRRRPSAAAGAGHMEQAAIAPPVGPPGSSAAGGRSLAAVTP